VVLAQISHEVALNTVLPPNRAAFYEMCCSLEEMPLRISGCYHGQGE